MRPSRRAWFAAGGVLAAFAFVFGSFALAQGLRYAHAPTHVTVKAEPIDHFDPRDASRTRFGQRRERNAASARAAAFRV